MHNILEALVCEVICEVKIRQIVPHARQPALPHVRRFLDLGVGHPLTLLRLDGLFARLGLEILACNHAAQEQFMPHPFANGVRQNWITAEPEIDAGYFWDVG